MLPQNRKRKIVALVSENDGCSVSALADRLEVSKVTIRRDLRELDDQGLVLRSHGGAVQSTSLGSQRSHDTRQITNLEAKQAIGRAARELFADDQVVVFDGGTTTLQVAKAAPPAKSIVPVTSSPPVALELNDKYGEVRVTGGTFRPRSKTVVGPTAEAFIGKLNFDLCFLATNAMSVDTGLTEPDEGESNLKRLMIENSKEVVLVADSSKIGEESFVQFGDFEDIDRFITDKPLSSPIRDAFEDAGTELIDDVL